MTTASPTPGEPAELKLSLPWHSANIVPGGWPRLPRLIARFLRCSPTVAEYNNLGNVLSDQGKLDEAAAQYERAVALKPGLFRGAQQPGQHPPAAGQARPGPGTVSSKRSL